MEDFDLQIVARKSVHGIFALVTRSLLAQILTIASNVVLTLFLLPSMFGVFFIVSAINVFLAYFQDIGLAALIIQKQKEPTLKELRATFTIQEILVLTVILLTLLLSPFFNKVFHLGQDGLYILYAYLFSFFLSSLKTIPTVLLERKLDFQKLVIPQLAESIAYSLCLIIFAIKGFGVQTFTYAILIRSLIGLPLIYFMQPWKIAFAWDKEVFKELVTHGSPFQFNSMLALVKDDLLNLYIGAVLPLSQVGFIGFGQKWAFMPLRLVMDNVIKVTFPAYSRLQHDKNALRIVIEKSLFLIGLFIFPLVTGFLILAPFLIAFIPKYHKWEPALISLFFFSLNALFASVTVPLTNLLNAIGRVKTTLKLMVFLTVLTWLLTPLFIKTLGYNGVSVASFLVAASLLLVLIPLKKQIRFSFWRPLSLPFLGSVFMALCLLSLKFMITSFASLFLAGLLSLGIYLLVIFLTGKKEVLKTINFLRSSENLS